MQHRWLVTAAVATALVPAAQLAYAVEYSSTDAAQRAAFPDASAFEPVLIAAEVKAAIAREAGRFAVEPRVWRVLSGEHPIGWFIVDEVIGKVELITYALALDATGAVKSLDVLAYRESHGDAIRLAAWRAQFAGKRASDPVKDRRRHPQHLRCDAFLPARHRRRAPAAAALRKGAGAWLKSDA